MKLFYIISKIIDAAHKNERYITGVMQTLIQTNDTSANNLKKCNINCNFF